MNRRSRKYNPSFFRKFSFIAMFTILFTPAAYALTMWLFSRFSFNVSGKQDWELLGGFVSVLTLSLLLGGLVITVIDRVNADIID
jgi:hypothetical protein